MFLLPLQMIGCSHETSPADQIGRMRLPSALVEKLLEELRDAGTNAVLLSTCHRTELYWWGDADLSPWFAAQVVPRAGGPMVIERREADLAVRHLFSVASGMRSVRFGEPEILRQVRSAWSIAQSVRDADAQLDSIFARAMEAARHIRLAIGSDADPALATRIREAIVARRESFVSAGRMAPLEILVVGAGDAARGVLEAIALPSILATGQWTIRVTSRSNVRGARLAQSFAIRSTPWEKRDDGLRTADVAIFAAQTSTPLIDAGLAARIGDDAAHEKLWLDLGVPANVDARQLPVSVEWVGLDALAPRSVHDAVRDRRATVALQHELARFATAMQRRRIGARIPAIEEHAATVARAALASTAVQQGTRDSADAVARQVTRLLLRELSEMSA